MCIRKVTHFISCVNLPLISSIRVVLLGRDWFTLEFSQARTYPACLSSARLVTCNQFVCLDGKSSGARPERAAVWMDARSSFLARRLKKSDAHTRKLRPREPGPEETDFDLVPPQTSARPRGGFCMRAARPERLHRHPNTEILHAMSQVGPHSGNQTRPNISV